MSILKANQWQLVSGSPVNTILQVQHQVLRNSKITLSSGEVKFMEFSITTKLDNSRILIDVLLPHGANNADVDLCAACGWATASSGSTSGYTSTHGTYTRQTISNLGSFWAQDTSDPNGGSWNGTYFVMARHYKHLLSPARPAGTTIYVSIWVGSDGVSTWGGSYNGTGLDNGQDATMTLWEVAP
jgi:hypothetical protein